MLIDEINAPDIDALDTQHRIHAQLQGRGHFGSLAQGDAELALNAQKCFRLFSLGDIHMKSDAFLLLAEESQRLAELYGLERPYRWITPGTYAYPTATPQEIKQTFGDRFGYTSAQTYIPTNSLKTYNEYDPDEVKEFGMLWGDSFFFIILF